MIIPIVNLDVNCPKCGLTKLIDQYCVTCEKHVIFKNRKDASPMIIETEELILTVDE